MRKLLAFCLVLSIIFGNFTSVSANEIKPQDLAKEIKLSRLQNIQDKYELQDDEEVRIIVELNKVPAIEYKSANLQDTLAEIETDQEKVMDEIKENNISVEYHHQFKNLVNGFSATTTLTNAKLIEALPDVKSVYIASEYNRPEPEMFTSGDFIDLPEAIEYNGKYTGEGTVVAIIDTGIDYNHKDMRLTNSENAKLSEQDVDTIVATNGLAGKYFTEKVPYGYNYFDNNNEVIDIGSGASMHGMHVAGTVGANSPDEDGLKGIAPETQLLALKVFGNNPAEESTYGDMIIAAIDDAIALGADVINMSLGSPAGFVDSADLEQQAVQRATDNGVICVISAGNSGYYGDAYFYPYTENPDMNMVGSPGLVESALQVASLENSVIHGDTINHQGQQYIYKGAGPKDPIQTLGTKEYEYVDCGLGFINDFNGVYGKIALIKRGYFSFADKVNNAYKQGAIAAIIYNHEDGGDEVISMNVGEAKIPAIFIGNSNGKLLRDSENKVVSFGGEKVVVNTLSGEMSEFSSWGTVSTLDIKPEITAPGGQIYSTLNNNKYGSMSGTSMAAPHVSGVMALVTQRLNEEFPDLKGSEKVLFAKNLVMSSAEPHVIDYSVTSPRQQGAGVINVYNAVSTPIVATFKNTGEAEVELKEVGDNLLFTITLTNYSDEDVTVYGSGNLLTQVSVDDYLIPYTIELLKKVDEDYLPIEIDFASEYVVPAKGSIDVDVNIDIQNAYTLYEGRFVKLTDIYENGTFIEGFIEFDSIDGVHIASIPYLGFYGEWDKAPILDGTIYTDDTIESFFDDSYFYDQFGRILGLGSDGDYKLANIVAGNPTNQFSSLYAIPRLTLLRNADEFKIMVLDSSKNYLKTIATHENIPKNTQAYDTPSWGWDLTVNGEYVQDGQYYIRVVTRIDYEGAGDQIFDYPIYVDHSMSTIQSVTLNEETMKLTIEATPAGKGIRRYGVWCYDIENNDLLDFYFDTNEIDLAKVESLLYNYDVDGHYQLIPVVESMNGSIDKWDEYYDLSLPIAVLPGITYAVFDEDVINMNVASELNRQADINVLGLYQMDPNVYGEGSYISRYEDMEKVFYLDYDSQIIDFVDHDTIEAVRAGCTEIEAIFVADEEMFSIVNIPYTTTSAVITTDSVVDMTTDAVVKLIDTEDLDGFIEGIDYYRLFADVIVFDTPEPIGAAENDNQPPTVVIESPTYKEVVGDEQILYDGSDYVVTIEGRVSDDSAIEYLTINDTDVDLTYNADEQQWEFEIDIPVDMQDQVLLDVEVSDLAENSVEFEHEFYVDTVNPTLVSVNLGNNVQIADGKTYLVIDEIKVTDYLPVYDVYVNEDLVYSKYEDFKSYDEKIINNTPSVIQDIYVPIKEGENTINIFVVDYAGNTQEWQGTFNYSTNSGNTSGSSGGSTSGSIPSGGTVPATEIDNTIDSSIVDQQLQDEVEVVEVKFDFNEDDSTEIKINNSTMNKLNNKDKSLGIQIGNAKVIIPNDALNKNDNESVVLKVNLSETKTPYVVSKVYDFEFTSTYSKKEDLNKFNKPLTIYLPVEAENVDTDSLAVYYLNEETNKWEVVGGLYDAETNSVVVRVAHFSKYAVFKSSKSFEDIKGHWAQKAIEVLASKGIINGKSVNEYDPNGTLTYAELIKLVVSTLGLSIEETEGKWYEPYVNAALEAGIITEAEAVMANETISRQNMAIILARALKTDDPFMKKYEPIEPIKFIDTIDISDDAVESINFISSTGILKGRGNNVFAPKDTLTRAEAATVIFRLLENLY